MGFLRGRRTRGACLTLRGLVLAGGKSSRFGRDKALAVYLGETLLSRAVNLLEAVGLKPTVVTRHGADYPFLQCPILRDKLPEKGPLGGIYTAMSVFRRTSFLVLTCDMPALTAFALRSLLFHKEEERLTVFSNSRRVEPFPGIYPASLFSVVGQKLVEGNHSMQALMEQAFGRKIIPWEDDADIFLNVNRKEDMKKGAVPFF